MGFFKTEHDFRLYCYSQVASDLLPCILLDSQKVAFSFAIYVYLGHDICSTQDY